MMLVLLCIIAAALLGGLAIFLDAYARYLRHAASIERRLNDMAKYNAGESEDRS